MGHVLEYETPCCTSPSINRLGGHLHTIMWLYHPIAAIGICYRLAVVHTWSVLNYDVISISVRCIGQDI